MTTAGPATGVGAAGADFTCVSAGVTNFKDATVGLLVVALAGAELECALQKPASNAQL
jgi:hypothetical protein